MSRFPKRMALVAVAVATSLGLASCADNGAEQQAEPTASSAEE